MKESRIYSAKMGGGESSDGWFFSDGNNLIQNDSNCYFGSLPTDIFGSDPMLGPLQDNGGATETRALLTGSPAIDAGSCSGTTTDQRGFTRPVDIPTISNADDGCDIGAYEFGSSQSPPTTPVYLPIVLK